MLKWKDVDVVRALVVTTPGYVRDATPADILACLNANPEVAATVFDALNAQVDAGAAPSGSERRTPADPPEPAGSSPCQACKGTGYLPANYKITGMTGTYRPWSPCPLCAPRTEPAGIVPCVIGPPLRFDGRGAFDVEPDPEAPANRADVEELRREILTTLSDALERIHIPVPGSSGWAEVPLGLRELAEELRRRIERLETKE